jgi:hypothetical protein
MKGKNYCVNLSAWHWFGPEDPDMSKRRLDFHILSAKQGIDSRPCGSNLKVPYLHL